MFGVFIARRQHELHGEEVVLGGPWAPLLSPRQPQALSPKTLKY
jgi:hypothetical protein